MAQCSNVCKLCNRLIISQSVTFDDTTNNLIVDIPSGTYARGEKYCIVVAQSIPDTTTITAPVYISIGGDTDTLYPLVRCNCLQVTACSINTRTKYSTVVVTDTVTGSFKLLGNVPCYGNNGVIASLPIATASATAVSAQSLAPNSTITKTTTTKTVVSNKTGGAE